MSNLHKFVATRIHQIRANKSYLRAQKSWINLHLPATCQRCHSADETAEHGILLCPATMAYRPDPLLSAKSLDEIWYDLPLTYALGAFIIASKVGYPVRDVPSPLFTGSTTISSLTTLSSPSSSTITPHHPRRDPFPPIYAS